MKPARTTGSVTLRLLFSIVVVVGFGLAIAYQLGASQRNAAQRELEDSVMSSLLGKADLKPASAVAFADADGDFVTDPPADEACVKPEKLVFSFIAGADPEEESAVWADLVTAVGDAVGVPMEYRNFATTQEQLDALAAGELHVTGLSTGTVPLAVSTAGFVPVCTLGREDGDFGYLMQMLAPADASFNDLKGFAASPRETRRVAFTSPTSNSGFKAAFIELISGHDLRPERDYEWVFSTKHDQSVKLLLSGDVSLAPVANDLLEQMIARGDVDDSKIKAVYTSERFPPAAIGYAHNLASELREGLRGALLAFEFAGTSLETRYGRSGEAKLVPVSYKDDWANVRRIDKAIRAAR